MTLYFKLNQNAIDRRHSIHFLTFDSLSTFKHKILYLATYKRKCSVLLLHVKLPKRKILVHWTKQYFFHTIEVHLAFSIGIDVRSQR